MRKTRFEFRYLVILFLFFFHSGSVLSQDPVFVAVVSSTRIMQHSVFEIQFELQNATSNEFQPPDFKNFKVISGPSLSSSTVIVNGKVTRGASWSYSLLATTPGTHTIGQATVVAGRRKLASRPVTVTVVESQTAASGSVQPGQGPIQLIAHVAPRDYYPGQQIVLEYKLLFTENIQSVNTLSEDDYADFFIQPFNSFSREATYETVNDITYVSRIIKAIALYPHQSGSYTIDPMILTAGVSAPYPANQGFFAMRRLHNIQVASPPLTINILPLPVDPDPSGFSGAVGQYEISTIQAGNPRISTDDDFTWRIEIKGNGDSRRWDPPAVIANGPFEMYDPRIIEDKAMDTDGAIIHSRIIEYTMIPREAGDFNVHVPFRFFNPETKQYETVHSDTIALQVSQGTLSPRSIVRDTMNAAPLPLKTVSSLHLNDRFWFSIPHLLLFGILVTGTFWGLWISYKRKVEASLSPEDRIRSLSSRTARHQLEQIELAKSDITDESFFEKLTETYYKFLSDKFNIPPADLDLDKIDPYLTQYNVPSDVKMHAIDFFQQCLSLRYGGIPSGSSREELIERCRTIIDELDPYAQLHI